MPGNLRQPVLRRSSGVDHSRIIKEKKVNGISADDK